MAPAAAPPPITPEIQLAIDLLRSGRPAQAKAQLLRHIDNFKNDAVAYFYLGVSNHQLGLKQASAEDFGRAANCYPDFFDAHFNRGNVLCELKMFGAAIESFQQAIKINPLHLNAQANLAATFFDASRHDEALVQYDKLIKLYPDNGAFLYARGTVLIKLKKHRDAVRDFDEALKRDRNNIDAHNNRGVALNFLGDHAQAASSLVRALELDPQFAAAHTNIALSYLMLRRLDLALTHCERGLELNAADSEGHKRLGDIHRAMGQYSEALQSYNSALALNHEDASARLRRAETLLNLKRLEEAAIDYKIAIELDPESPYAIGHHLHCLMQMCDWREIDSIQSIIRSKLSERQDVAVPFVLLATPFSLREQRQSADILSRRHMNAAQTAKPPRANFTLRQREKIKIGYFSPEFYAHAVAFLTIGVFEQHDREKFEVIGFSYGRARQDSITARLNHAFDLIIDVSNLSDDEVASKSRAMGIHIAVDLAGYTGEGRQGIFAHRAAPVQVNLLGFPGTMGLGFMDYIIGDEILIPPDQKLFYGEKVVYMPYCFQANDDKRKIGPEFSRSEFGLDNSSFVYCCFNSSYKINAQMFDVWIEILRHVESSVLWLVESNTAQVSNLKHVFARSGLDPHRLKFTGGLDYATHLSRYRLADLALDTLPFNGGATTSDALWAGVPVLTCLGNTFAGRMAASLLSAVGLNELVTHTLTEYRELAITLGQNKNLLKLFQQTLNHNRLTYPLFDTTKYVRHLEIAYGEMVERHNLGLPASDITIPKNQVYLESAYNLRMPVDS